MKKVLLYGNCQLGMLSNLIDKRIKNIEILRPRNFSIPITKLWHNNVFFPIAVLKHDGLLEALEVCDIFIFQDIKKDIYWKSEDLKKISGKRKEAVVTTFYFDYADTQQSIMNLEDRRDYIKQTYKCPFVDMTPWIKENYSKINILTSGNQVNHPIDKYYEDMLYEMHQLGIFL